MSIPTVSLIGLGKFGCEYYKELARLERTGNLKIGFLSNRTGVSPFITSDHQIFSYSEIPASSIARSDLFVVVSPGVAHADHVAQLSSHGHVLVEKPAAVDLLTCHQLECTLRRSKYIVEVAQIFRYHPLTEKLLLIAAEMGNSLASINCEFVNAGPIFVDYSYSLELNHMLDIALILAKEYRPVNNSLRTIENLEYLSIILEGNRLLTSTCGWHGKPFRKRSIKLVYPSDHIFLADYCDDTLVEMCNNSDFVKTLYPPTESLIRLQLLDMLDKISFKRNDSTRVPITRISDSLQLCKLIRHSSVPTHFSSSNRPRAAVIGGGIFGSCCAIELAKDFHVDLFEEKSELLQMASLNNQWRHHHGFHYPLSFETLTEISNSRPLFEENFGSCIIDEVSSYYFVSRWASEISAQRYLSSCNLAGLKYDICPPPLGVDPASVSICLLTPEKIYDIGKLRKLLKHTLADCGISVNFSTSIKSLSLEQDGLKTLQLSSHSSPQLHSRTYDFVVNCTNGLGSFSLFNLPSFNTTIRKQLVELLEVEVDYSMHCLTVIDGPFVSMTSMGIANRFMLSHKDHSLHKTSIAKCGENISSTPFPASNATNIINSARMYFPVLNKSRLIRSHFGYKGISPYTKEVWERPTEVRDHGFGTVTVIGGKILVAPSIARDVCKLAKSYMS